MSTATNIDWGDVYRRLHAYGVSDVELSQLSGVTRSVVNKVRNSQYEFKHDPGYTRGRDLLNLLQRKDADAEAAKLEAQHIEPS